MSVAATPLLLAASTPPAPAPVPANAEVKRSDPTPSHAAPDPALLEYLGRYAEAADDFDALGFDLPPASPPTPAQPEAGKGPR